MSTQQIETSATQQGTVECDYHDCHEVGDNPILQGVAHLCLVHFLRDRVRLNLARLAS